MASEPALPPLIAGGGDNGNLADSAFEGSSSDPALFSSDDLRDVSCEDYVSNRRKRQYRGTWWGIHKTRRKLRRTVDSGVFMGSEGTEGSADDVLEELQRRSSLSETSSGRRRASEHGILDFYSSSSRRRAMPTESTFDHRFHPYAPSSIAPRITIESRVDTIISRCLEAGVDRVDLSGQRLTHLSNATIGPLKHLVKTPNFNSYYTDSDSFESMIPSIDLRLNNNHLRSLPKQLFQLEHLTILNLRYNCITELPPAIGDLKNLEELHLEGNELRALPYEILKLLGKDGKLRVLSLCSNPLLNLVAEPIAGHSGVVFSAAEAVSDILGSKADGRSGNAACHAAVAAAERRPSSSTQPKEWEPQHLVSTSLKHLAIDGSLYTNPASTVILPSPTVSTSPSSSGVLTPASSAGNSPVRLSPSPDPVSAAPSLFETALRICYNHDALEHLHTLLPLDAPESVSRALREACRIRETNEELSCTVCGKWYLLPRTEWIEWWDCIPPRPDFPRKPAASPEEEAAKTVARAVPLIRRGCSWACQPNNLSRTDNEEK